jgi:hypothetical protein
MTKTNDIQTSLDNALRGVASANGNLLTVIAQAVGEAGGPVDDHIVGILKFTAQTNASIVGILKES